MISDSELQEMQAIVDAAPKNIWGDPDEDCNGELFPCLEIGVEEFYEKALTMVSRLLEEVKELQHIDKDNDTLNKQLAEARKENAQFRGERLELEKDMGRAQILIRQHQEQSQTNLRLWEEAREEIKKFLANWEEVKPHVDAMCLMEANRGREYKGPFLDLEGLRKLI